MKRKQLLLLLALLMTAATGAWAQDAKHVITATYDKQTRLLEQPLPYETTVGELYEAVTGQSFNDFISFLSAAYELNLTGITSDNTDVVSIGEFNDASTPVTVNADGEATVRLNFSGYVKGIHVSVVPPLYVTMADGTKDAAMWTATVGTNSNAQALPVGKLSKGNAVTLTYGGRLKVKNVTATHDGWDGDLSNIPASLIQADGTVIVPDGTTLTGTLNGSSQPYKITIAADATVTLDGVTINGVNNTSYKWAGLNCLGNATIVLKDGTTNTVRGFYMLYPGIHVPAGSTLTIQGGTEGTGKLTASPYDGGTDDSTGAGIGGGFTTSCGDIDIQGGVITATGGLWCAGIGGGCNQPCGNISIEGGTVTATGGPDAAGIGGGLNASCGNITIASTVTRVTATNGGAASHSIGAGNRGTCGTITIGGTVYWQDNAALNDGATYLAQATIVYPKVPATVTTAPKGAAAVGVGKNTALVSGGVANGGTLMYQMTTTYTMPTSTAGFSTEVPTAKDIKATGYVYVWYFVKADGTHSDSEIAPIKVPVADIVWDVTNVSDLYVSGTSQSYAKEGVTLSANAEMNEAMWNDLGGPEWDGITFNVNESGGYKFTAPNGKAFTKIVMTLTGNGGWDLTNLGDGWAFDWDMSNTVTWKGDSATSPVDLLTGVDMFDGATVKCIAFYLSE